MQQDCLRLPRSGDKIYKVKLVRRVVLHPYPNIAVGSVAEVPEDLARELIENGNAEPAAKRRRRSFSISRRDNGRSAEQYERNIHAKSLHLAGRRSGACEKRKA